MNFAFIEALAAFAGLMWTANQLRRAPRHRSLWLIAACLLAAEAVYVLGMDSVAAAINTTVGAGASKLPQNLAVMIFHFLVIWFFLDAARTPRSRVRRQAIICAVACIALIGARLGIPPADRGTLYGLTMHSVPVGVLPYPLYLPRLRVDRGIACRVGLWAVVAATSKTRLMDYYGCAGWEIRRRPVLPRCGHCRQLARSSGGTLDVPNIPYHPGHRDCRLSHRHSGAVVRLLALRRWWQHRRAYHGLEPLWRLMYQAFPEDVLHRVPSGRLRYFTGLRSMHRRYYRRVIECRDGLVRINPYLPRNHTAGGEPSTAVGWARLLEAALHAHAHQRPPTGPPMVLARPRGPDLDADVTELLSLARALNTLNSRKISPALGRRPRRRG